MKCKSKIKIFFLLMISFYIKKYDNKEIQLSNNDCENNYYINYSNRIEENQKLGNYSEIIIQNLEKVNINLNKIDNKYQFLTYEVIPNYGKINVSICNKSLCEPSDFIIIKGYKSYFYTIEKKNDSDTTPNLEVKCIEGVENNDKSKCILRVNIYTDNDYIYMDEDNNNDIVLYKYISKNNENNYFLNDNDSYLYINLFSGNISLNSKIISYENPFYFDFINKSTNLTIIANEDSFYSINLNNHKNNIENSFIIGSYYLFNKSTINIKLIDNFYYYGQKEYLYYLGIYSENKISINIKDNCNEKNIQSKEKTTDINVVKGFYQNISSSNDDFDFTIINKNKINYYASIYQLDNINGISLANKIPQSFIFNNYFNKNVTFSYPHIQKSQDLNISFGVNKGDSYKITIYLNDNQTNNISYNIKENYKIYLTSDTIIKNCSNFLYICKVSLFIESENLNSKLTIIVNGDINSNRKKTVFIVSLLIICGVGLLIMIFIILCHIIKTARKKDDLNEKIRTTYFEKEMIENENEEDKDPLE